MTPETKSENIPYKKQQLIDSAQILFSKHGIQRVTVEELCRTAEISKMTFYKYFTNKWDIGRAVIDITFEKGLSYYNNMIQEDIPFAEKIEQILKIMFQALMGLLLAIILLLNMLGALLIIPSIIALFKPKFITNIK